MDITIINAKVGTIFEIVQEEMAGAGYLCEPQYDEVVFLFGGRKQESEESNITQQELPVGGAVNTTYIFEAAQKGEFDIVMVHRRPWESEILKSVHFRIIID